MISHAFLPILQVLLGGAKRNLRLSLDFYKPEVAAIDPVLSIL